MPIKLTWTEPATGSPFLSFNIYKRVGQGEIDPVTHFLRTVPGNQLSFDDTDYDRDTLSTTGYLYQISANNNFGEGPLSNSVLITHEFPALLYTEGWDSIFNYSAVLVYLEVWDEFIDLTLNPVYLEPWDSEL